MRPIITRYCLNARGKYDRLFFMDYNSPASIAKLMEQHNIHPLKRFGQNFLINENARASIVASICGYSAKDAKSFSLSRLPSQPKNPLEALTVWEVGPGLGSITKPLLDLGARVVAFEIDKAYIELLSGFFASFIKNGKLIIVAGDVLSTWEKTLSLAPPDITVGNLPYNIAATFIASTIERGALFPRCVYTTQKEVATRLAANPCAKDYSSLSVLVQTYYKVQKVLDIPPSSFYPVPQVLSTCVALTKKSEEPLPDPKAFSSLVRQCFSKRRKMLSNNIDPAILESANIDQRRRAETLGGKEFLSLYEAAISAKTL